MPHQAYLLNLPELGPGRCFTKADALAAMRSNGGRLATDYGPSDLPPHMAEDGRVSGSLTAGVALPPPPSLTRSLIDEIPH